MDKIGKYKVERELGSGGFGAVYLAEDPRLREKVAIKVFQIKDENLANQATSTASDASEVLRTRFLNEAKVLRQLSRNAYIVDVYDFDETETGVPYYVMPYLNSSLRNLLGTDDTDVSVISELDPESRPKSLPVPQALVFLEQLLIALEDVHKAGLVHRDIKPANILLDTHNDVKLCDFGIAKAPNSDISYSGIGMGSRNYMAPEQRQSAKHVDARSDIYSVGVVAYRMLTGTLPEGRFQDPKTYQPNLGDDINAIIVKALEQRKENRFENAADMLTALKSASKSTAENIQDDTTETFVAGDVSFRAELTPVVDKIEACFLQQGEVLPQDRVMLTALAELVELSSEELEALISQIETKVANTSSQQKAFHQWIVSLSKYQSREQALTPSERHTMIEAAALTTGRDKLTLNSIIDAKFPDSKQTESPQSAPREERQSPSDSLDITYKLAYTLAQSFESREVDIKVPQGAQQRVLRVRIPAGVTDGSRIRLKGEGKPGIGDQPAGDLYVHIDMPADNHHRIDGLDLHTTVQVSDKLWGTSEKFTYTTPGEVTVQLQMKPAYQDGQVLKLRDYGLPDVRNPDKKGDLFLTLTSTQETSVNIKPIKLLIDSNLALASDGTLSEAIGIETLGGVFTPMVDKGTDLSTPFKQEFSTAEDNQSAISVRLFKGNGEKVKDTTALGVFEIEGIKPAKAGEPRIELRLYKENQNLFLQVADLNGNELSLIKQSSSTDPKPEKQPSSNETTKDENQAQKNKPKGRWFGVVFFIISLAFLIKMFVFR